MIGGFFLHPREPGPRRRLVAINGIGGLVEAINLRTTLLRDEEGTVHVFPNGNINTLANRSKEFSYYVINLPLAYGEDIDAVAALLRGDRREMQEEDAYKPFILAPLEVIGVDAFEESGVRLKMRIKTAPQKQWFVGREFRRRITEALSERGIQMCSPQRTAVMPPPRRRVSSRDAAGRRLLPARLLDDLDAGAGADAGRAGRDHRLQPFEIAHAAGGLDAHLGADDAAHQRDVGGGRAAGGEAGRRLDEVGARRLRQRARGDLLVVGQQRRFDDHLADRAGLAARLRRPPRCRARRLRRSPDFSAPTLITMSISAAPSKIARRVS